MTDNVRVRFAPSPTGHPPHRRRPHRHLQLGVRPPPRRHVRAAHRGHRPRALHRGEHRRRSSARCEWLGLDWDEGPEVGGDYGPYFQTQRFDRYAEGLEQLKATGHAYPCFCTRRGARGQARGRARRRAASPATTARAARSRRRRGRRAHRRRRAARVAPQGARGPRRHHLRRRRPRRDDASRRQRSTTSSSRAPTAPPPTTSRSSWTTST